VQVAAAAAGRREVGRVRVAYAGASTHLLVGRLAREVRQHHPGIQFELLNRAADRRLGHVQLLRGPIEVEIVDHCDNGPDLLQGAIRWLFHPTHQYASLSRAERNNSV
jgi:hypothetical protein